MKNIPELPTPNACNSEAQQIIGRCTEIVRWIAEHRKDNHPNEPAMRRMLIICDHGPEWAPLLAFAGEDPPSPEYVSDLLAQAWNCMTEKRAIQ